MIETIDVSLPLGAFFLNMIRLTIAGGHPTRPANFGGSQLVNRSDLRDESGAVLLVSTIRVERHLTHRWRAIRSKSPNLVQIW